MSLGTLNDIADESGCILCIPIDNDLILSSTDLSKHLLERCGEDLQEEICEVNKLIMEQGIDFDTIDGWIIPVHSHNLRRFKGLCELKVRNK